MGTAAYRQHHDVHDADDLHGHTRATVVTIARTTVITVTEFSFGRIGASGGTIRVRSPCAISAVRRPEFRDPALHLLPSADFAQQCTVLIQIAAFQLLLYLAANFSRRRLPSSSAFGSSTPEWSASWCVQCYAADDAHGSNEQQRTASTARTTSTTDTVT